MSTYLCDWMRTLITLLIFVGLLPPAFGQMERVDDDLIYHGREYIALHLGDLHLRVTEYTNR